MRSNSHSIKDIIVTPIAVPDPPLLNCVGVHAPYALRIILEVVTEGGVTGISEIPGNQETEDAILRIKKDLIGLDARSPGGSLLGKVTSVEFGSAQNRLVVTTPDGVEVQVPFVDELVGDPEDGSLEIRDPGGLF